jgi:hypothetical protein
VKTDAGGRWFQPKALDRVYELSESQPMVTARRTLRDFVARRQAHLDPRPHSGFEVSIEVCRWG